MLVLCELSAMDINLLPADQSMLHGYWMSEI